MALLTNPPRTEKIESMIAADRDDWLRYVIDDCGFPSRKLETLLDSGKMGSAIKLRSLKVVKLLLELMKEYNFPLSSERGELNSAIERGDVELVKLFIGVDFVDADPYSLAIAASEGHTEIVELFLPLGKDATFQFFRTLLAIHPELDESKRQNARDATERLLENNDDAYNDGLACMILGDVKRLQKLLASSCDRDLLGHEFARYARSHASDEMAALFSVKA